MSEPRKEEGQPIPTDDNTQKDGKTIPTDDNTEQNGKTTNEKATTTPTENEKAPTTENRTTNEKATTTTTTENGETKTETTTNENEATTEQDEKQHEETRKQEELKKKQAEELKEDDEGDDEEEDIFTSLKDQLGKQFPVINLGEQTRHMYFLYSSRKYKKMLKSTFGELALMHNCGAQKLLPNKIQIGQNVQVRNEEGFVIGVTHETAGGRYSLYYIRRKELHSHGKLLWFLCFLIAMGTSNIRNQED